MVILVGQANPAWGSRGEPSQKERDSPCCLGVLKEKGICTRLEKQVRVGNHGGEAIAGVVPGDGFIVGWVHLEELSVMSENVSKVRKACGKFDKKGMSNWEALGVRGRGQLDGLILRAGGTRSIIYT